MIGQKIMATAAVEGKAMQNYVKPEHGGMQPGGLSVKSNSIHDLIFVKLKENPNPEPGIQQAMKLLASMNEDLFRITQKLQERQHDDILACFELDRLENGEKRFRWTWTDNGKKLASLKRDLDKLTFANNAYKERAVKTEGKINIHNLNFVMHHGTNNMAKEKKLLKGINDRQKKGDHCDDPGLSVVQEISDRIRRLRWDISRKYFFPKPAIRVDEQQVLKEITELKWARDKAFANAPVEGKTWNSLASKTVIKQQIKRMEKASCDEDRKKHLQMRAKIQVLKQEIDVVKKDIASLKRQLLNVRRKKGEAYKVILKLIKIQNQAI
ncbi:Uncharacterized protein TCM_020218 [Theobroma cacao]|uniref:Proton pump interactor 1 n=1 Tax=Theobroma cacao TaxID=3641 RepID=A0A061EJE8_THECC|nr:Uncharacterized protein TCM_020218 [Theobroma cacao]